MVKLFPVYLTNRKTIHTCSLNKIECFRSRFESERKGNDTIIFSDFSGRLSMKYPKELFCQGIFLEFI